MALSGAVKSLHLWNILQPAINVGLEHTAGLFDLATAFTVNHQYSAQTKTFGITNELKNFLTRLLYGKPMQIQCCLGFIFTLFELSIYAILNTRAFKIENIISIQRFYPLSHQVVVIYLAMANRSRPAISQSLLRGFLDSRWRAPRGGNRHNI